MRQAGADAVRARIAAAMLDDTSVAPATVGTVRLRPHQRDAAGRVRAALATSGGALLAERVGVGKTYTALAVAAAARCQVLIVAPASLRAMWTDALRDCAVAATIVTHEALSRGTHPPPGAELVIVDEAHRFRSPGCKRYATLAQCCRTARVLLLSATPVQNSRADLAAQMALFLGRRAWQMTDDELAAFIIRGTDAPHGMPRLVGPRLIALPPHDWVLDRIVALPPPVPARDEGTAPALLAYSLVHQWTSSAAALVSALQRRRARATALLDAIEQGHAPTRAELSAWAYEDDALQLAFPQIVAAADAATHDLGELARSVDAHRAAVEALVHDLRAAPDPDVERAEAIRRLRAAHPGERILIFCHYGETAAQLGRLCAPDGGVATLSARGARIASGRAPRSEILAQFTPGAAANRVRPAERIDVLIATDLLSEGLNLQEASVVVHADMPWNPARLEQRVGRVHRLGSRHAHVSVYSFAPPASAEHMLGIERRLTAKIRVAQHAVGVAGAIVPSAFGVIVSQPSAAEAQSSLRSALADWLPEAACTADDAVGAIVAAVESPVDGWIAAVEQSGRAVLIGGSRGGITTDPSALRELVAHANGVSAQVGCARAEPVVARIDAWLNAQRGAVAIDLAAASSARARRAALARVAQALARAPRHQRAQMSALADAARVVATAPLGEGAERVLATLVGSELPDEAWLRSVAAFGQLNARPRPDPRPNTARILAVLLLIATEPASL